MAQTQDQGGDPLPFPPEVRIMIYRSLLTSTLPIIIGLAGIFSFPHGSEERPDLSILRVNKATMQEALPIFYDQNDFTMKRAMALAVFRLSKPNPDLQNSITKQKTLPFAKFKLANVKHLTLGKLWDVNNTRLKELKQLRSLQKLTFEEDWRPSGLVFDEFHFDFTLGGDKYKDDAGQAMRASIEEWFPAEDWYSQHKEFTLARPEVELEIVVRPGPNSIGVVADTACPKIEAIFRATWEEANERYVMYYESEQPAASPGST